MPLYCQKCGADARVNFKFCPVCGGTHFDTRLPGAAKVAAPSAYAAAPPAYVSPLSAGPAPVTNFGINVSGMSYASPGRRLLAALIDTFIIAIGIGVAQVVVGAMPPTLAVVAAVLVIAGLILYWVLQEGGTHQATVGKRCLGLVVAGMDGGRITKQRAFGRYFLKAVTGSFLVPYIVIFFTERKQALHDLWGGTVVMYRGN